jgi:hypothetical protein
MEATSKERSSSATAQENDKDKQQQQNNGKGTGKDKQWWEQFIGAIPEDKEEQKKWYKLLAHPLVVIAGLISLEYWWINQKQNHFAKVQQENEEGMLHVNFAF